jgi:osmotically-inducible protein OsmY
VDNTELQQAVRDELAADPKIDHREVAVSVGEDGVVNLRGTVGASAARRRQKPQNASYGVQEVKNDLDVRP